GEIVGFLPTEHVPDLGLEIGPDVARTDTRDHDDRQQHPQPGEATSLARSPASSPVWPGTRLTKLPPALGLSIAGRSIAGGRSIRTGLRGEDVVPARFIRHDRILRRSGPIRRAEFQRCARNPA